MQGDGAGHSLAIESLVTETFDQTDAGGQHGIGRVGGGQSGMVGADAKFGFGGLRGGVSRCQGEGPGPCPKVEGQ